MDVHGEDSLQRKATGDHFLLEGRGGEDPIPPPLHPRLVNGFSNNDEEGSPPPPPLPAKQARRTQGTKLQGIAEEERTLIDELELLEKLVDPSSSTATTAADVTTQDVRNEETPAITDSNVNMNAEKEEKE